MSSSSTAVMKTVESSIQTQSLEPGILSQTCQEAEYRAPAAKLFGMTRLQERLSRQKDFNCEAVDGKQALDAPAHAWIVFHHATIRDPVPWLEPRLGAGAPSTIVITKS